LHMMLSYVEMYERNKMMMICVWICMIGQPVQMQPVLQWMAPPPTIPGVAPGLEYLTQVDQLLIHQQIEIMERKLLSKNDLRTFNSRTKSHTKSLENFCSKCKYTDTF